MLNIGRWMLLSVLFLCIIGCEERAPDKGDTKSTMSDFETKEPLIFDSMFDLRSKLTEVYSEGGLEELKGYVSEEFTAQRAIEIGGQTSSLFDVQLRHLNDGNPGDTILDFKNNPTAENSRLLMTVNLVDTEPNLQLVIRKNL
jgi:hypothetical protein